MDWIDKQRSEHEPAHQWELKRKFMKKNKDKFSKEELCGLAQTMGNIEFLGCRYPRETHQRIAKLSVGIIEEYREKKKGKLQRTFVRASDAAEGKVNRNTNKRPNTDEESTLEKKTVNKALKYGMFVSSAKDDDEDNKLKGGIYAPKNPVNKPNEDSMGFCNQDINAVSSSSEEDDEAGSSQGTNDLSDSSILQCGLCKEICKRGVKTDCCGSIACRACAIKEITRYRNCWSCNSMGLISENLVNDDLLRTAVDHFKIYKVLLPEHKHGLAKKVEAPASHVERKKKGKLQRTFVKAVNAECPNTDEESIRENKSAKKALKYGMFVSSSTKEDDNQLEVGKENSVNKPSEDFMDFCNQVISDSTRGLGFKEKFEEDKLADVTTTNTLKYGNFVKSSSKDDEAGSSERTDSLSDSSILQCGLCKEICKRGAKTNCCSARACRACATKEIIKSRTCWSCNALGLSSESLVNDDLLRTAVDYFKIHKALLPEHKNGLAKKVEAPASYVKRTPASATKKKVISKPDAPTAHVKRTPASATKKKEISHPLTRPLTAPNKPSPFRRNESYRRQKNTFRNNQQPSMNLNLDYSFPLHNFIVVMLDYMDDEHPCNLLRRSGTFSKMQVDWDYFPNRGSVTCAVKVGDNIVCEVAGTTKQGARDRATEKAIRILQQHCYTILIKNKYLSDGTKVDLMEVEVNTVVGGDKPALGSENVGHKLLAMMGWSGGGLGKEGSGISEPITANLVFGREGLGTKGVLKNFKEKITKIMYDYIQSSNPHDLVFTTGFDNGQRAEMHQIARRLGLKSKSFGKGEDRFLTITRKQMNGIRLLEDLIQQGGSTQKYSVLEPGEPEPYNCPLNPFVGVKK